MAAVRVANELARLDRELTRLPKTCMKHVENASALLEGHDSLEPRRVQCQRHGLLGARVDDLVGPGLCVPDANGLVGAARGDNRALDARVHLPHGPHLASL